MALRPITAKARVRIASPTTTTATRLVFRDPGEATPFPRTTLPPSGGMGFWRPRPDSMAPLGTKASPGAVVVLVANDSVGAIVGVEGVVVEVVVVKVVVVKVVVVEVVVVVLTVVVVAVVVEIVVVGIVVAVVGSIGGSGFGVVCWSGGGLSGVGAVVVVGVDGFFG